MKKKYVRQSFLAVLITAALVMAGCVSSSNNYGHFQKNRGVKAAFENEKVDPAYNYYYYGVETFPKAVIGLSKGITLVSDLWEPIDLTPEKLHNWIWLHAKRHVWTPFEYGAVILNDAGKKIGVWYSLESWQQWTTIEILGENKVKIGSPVGGNDNNRRNVFINGIRL